MSLSKSFTNLPSDNIPAFVVFNLMYRDADNWKNSQAYGFANDEKLTVAEIAAWFDAHMPTEDILAKRYELPNLAPVDNEHDICDGADHCFMELSELDICDHLSPMTEKSETPFSVIYHKAINADSPESLQAWSVDEQNVVLERWKQDNNTLLTDFKDTQPDVLRAAMQPDLTKLADFCGKKLVNNDAKVAREGDTILPGYVDIELMAVILRSALNYPKGRRELTALYGEKRIADFHAAFFAMFPGE